MLDQRPSLPSSTMQAINPRLELSTATLPVEEPFRKRQETLQHSVLYLQRQVWSLNDRIQRVDIELEQSRNERLAAIIERSRWTLVANRQEMLFLHEQTVDAVESDEVTVYYSRKFCMHHE